MIPFREKPIRYTDDIKIADCAPLLKETYAILETRWYESGLFPLTNARTPQLDKTGTCRRFLCDKDYLSLKLGGDGDAPITELHQLGLIYLEISGDRACHWGYHWHGYMFRSSRQGRIWELWSGRRKKYQLRFNDISYERIYTSFAKQRIQKAIQPLLPEPIISDTFPRVTVTKHGYIYLIKKEGSDIYKIGKSIDPVTRIHRFEIVLPFPIVPIHVIDCVDYDQAEIDLHRRYAHRRIRGEWFALTPDEVTEIKAITQM